MLFCANIICAFITHLPNTWDAGARWTSIVFSLNS
jgi:hypothetical protein